jgi:hypothetical protein
MIAAASRVVRSGMEPTGRAFARPVDSIRAAALIFCPTGKSVVFASLPVQPHLQKYFRFPLDPNQFTDSCGPVPHRGGSRSSRTRGGMRWTRAARLTNGADADGEVVWF